MNADERKAEIDHESSYLSEAGILPAHRIRVRLAASHPSGQLEGTVVFDHNICMLNEWGDAAGCTTMVMSPRAANAVRLQAEDPHNHKRRLWALYVDGITEFNLHLVEYDGADLWCLVVQTSDGRSATAPLFPRGLFEPGS